MRIDAYTHFIPPKFFEKLVDSGFGDIGKRMRGVPSIHDMDVRNRVVDSFENYAQILSYPMPPLEYLAAPDAEATIVTAPPVKLPEDAGKRFWKTMVVGSR